MKKVKDTALVSTVLSGLLLVQNVAMASTQVKSIGLKEGLVSVTVTTDKYLTDEEGDILPKAITFEVYPDDVENPTKADIKGFGEVYADSQTYTFAFGLKNSGKYKIRISDNDGKVDEPFVYIDSFDRQEFADKINACLDMPDKTPENIANAAKAIHNIIVDEDNYDSAISVGINVDEYKKYSSELQIAITTKVVEIALDSSMREDVFSAVYKEAEAVSRLNCDDKTIAKETIELLNPEFEGTKFDKISDKLQKEWIKDNIVSNKTYDKMEDIISSYNKASALYIITTAKVLDVREKVCKYAKLLGIEETAEYKTYIGKINSTADKKLIEIISKEMLQTSDELLEALDMSISYVDINKEDGGFNGGKSSGSKGGFSVAGVYETSENNPDTDVVRGNWAYNAINQMQSEGVVAGDGSGNFFPQKTVKREEFVKMIVEAFKLESETASSHFHDVFDSDWFYPYVSIAFEKGIVMGDPLGLFGVNNGITREDTMVIASRVLKYAGKTIEAKRDYTNFNDEALIADYAKAAVNELYCMGIINGTDNGNFEPKRFCTRAEAALIIYNISR